MSSVDVISSLKSGPEQQTVVGPLVNFLIARGWSLGQILFGRSEWKVPKNPSEASKREGGRAYDNFPVDIAVFDSPENVGDFTHLLFIVECKQENKNVGIQQLETYLGLEPHVKLGILANSANPSSECRFVYKTSVGLEKPLIKKISDMPHPGDPLTPYFEKLTYENLVIPDTYVLQRTFRDLMGVVVANDTNVTRAEQQLDQLCDLILLKLDSDKKGSMDEHQDLSFRTRDDITSTAENIRKLFITFTNLYPDVFIDDRDRKLDLNDDTLYACVEKLQRMNLLKVGPETVSTAFQVLRQPALKQEEGQFFTPKPVIEAAVKMVDISLDDIVMDPACGTGGFLVESLIDVKERYPQNEAAVSKWAQLHLFGIDKDRIGVKLTKATMQILGDGSANCVRGDSVRKHLWAARYPHLESNKFSDGRFTVIFTNPPFGKDLKISWTDAKKSGLSITEYIKEGRGFELGLAMLNRCHDLLCDGGRLCILLPETYFFSPSYRFVREWMKGRLTPISVINVPMDAFQGYCRAKTNLYIFRKTESDESSDYKVLFSNPKTCGIYKNGSTRFVIGADGERTDIVDNELLDVAIAHRNGTPSSVPSYRVPIKEIAANDILVPNYYDMSFNRDFDELIKKLDIHSITLGELVEQGLIEIHQGNGSPSNDQRDGTIPYIKVSDIRNLRVNINPTNLVPAELAKKLWKGERSTVRAWDLVTPGRTSNNIGEFAVFLPGEEEVVLTKEILLIRVRDNHLLDPFYLLWALSLKCVRLEWKRVVLMQTNREDVGERFKEVKIPLPPSKEWADNVSASFRNYFHSLSDASDEFIHSTASDGFSYIESIRERR